MDVAAIHTNGVYSFDCNLHDILYVSDNDKKSNKYGSLNHHCVCWNICILYVKRPFCPSNEINKLSNVV